MTDTKERILDAALRLFARDGYEAVSVSAIAGELGMAKSALYRHYPSKRAVLDGIVARMRREDARRAQSFSVPVGTADEMPEAYRQTTLASIRAFSKAQFAYWTEDPFAARFRKLLTLEQYRNPEMARLFHQHLGLGPLGYLEDLFAPLTGDRAEAARLALRFYAPMFFLYSLYDGAADKKEVTARLYAHVDHFSAEEAALEETVKEIPE